MFSTVAVLVTVSISSLTGSLPVSGNSAKPQRSIVDTGNGGGATSDVVHTCGLTPNGSAQCWVRWGA